MGRSHLLIVSAGVLQVSSRCPPSLNWDLFTNYWQWNPQETSAANWINWIYPKRYRESVMKPVHSLPEEVPTERIFGSPMSGISSNWKRSSDTHLSKSSTYGHRNITNTYIYILCVYIYILCVYIYIYIMCIYIYIMCIYICIYLGIWHKTCNLISTKVDKKH